MLYQLGTLLLVRRPWRTIGWTRLPWGLWTGSVAGLGRLRLVAWRCWFGAIAGLLLGRWCVAGLWLWRWRSIAGTRSWRLRSRTILWLLRLRSGLVSRFSWRGRWWLIGRLGRFWWFVSWLCRLWWAICRLCRRRRWSIVRWSRLACSVRLLWRRGRLGWSWGVHHVDRGRVVRLVDQDRQLMVGQGHVLYRGGRRVLPSVASVGIRRLKNVKSSVGWTTMELVLPLVEAGSG